MNKPTIQYDDAVSAQFQRDEEALRVAAVARLKNRTTKTKRVTPHYSLVALMLFGVAALVIIYLVQG